MTQATKSRRLAKWASVIVLIIVAIYFVGAARQHIDSIPPIRWNLAAWLALMATVLCMFVNLVCGGLMWMALLRDQGVRLPALAAFRIVGMAQVAKYLPGNVGHLVG